jgi:hypothetical protein
MGARIATPLVLVIAALPAVACGEDDSDDATTTTTTALTKQEFVREANRICTRTDDKLERASRQFFADAPSGEEAPPEEIEQFGDKTVYPTIQDEIDRIRALGAPAGDEDQVEALLDAAQRGLDTLKDHPDQLPKGGAAPAFDEANRLAGNYGLDQCAGA